MRFKKLVFFVLLVIAFSIGGAFVYVCMGPSGRVSIPAALGFTTFVAALYLLYEAILFSYGMVRRIPKRDSFLDIRRKGREAILDDEPLLPSSVRVQETPQAATAVATVIQKTSRSAKKYKCPLGHVANEPGNCPMCNLTLREEL